MAEAPVKLTREDAVMINIAGLICVAVVEDPDWRGVEIDLLATVLPRVTRVGALRDLAEACDDLTHAARQIRIADAARRQGRSAHEGAFDLWARAKWRARIALVTIFRTRAGLALDTIKGGAAA